jgi:hypothetical protein
MHAGLDVDIVSHGTSPVLLLYSESDQWIQPRCPPGWNNTCCGSNQKECRNDGYRYKQVKEADTIPHRANELRRRDGGTFGRWIDDSNVTAELREIGLAGEKVSGIRQSEISFSLVWLNVRKADT